MERGLLGWVAVTANEIGVDEIMPSAHRDRLSPEDLVFLREREVIVTNGVKASIAAARALYEIHCYRDGALWKANHESFEQYCQSRWNLQKSQAYRLVDVGEFIVELESNDSPRGEKMPVNEGQLRPLITAVPKEHRVECWREIVRGRNPAELSSTIVGADVRKFLNAKGLSAKASKSGKEPAAQATMLEFLTHEVGKLRTSLVNLPHPESPDRQRYEIHITIDNHRLCAGRSLRVFGCEIALADASAV